MKTIYSLLIISFILGTIACQKESNLSDILSQQDKIALQGMEESYETAKAWNDSLIWCNEIGNNCTPSFINYCDSIFHHKDDMFEMHHNNYSHNNTNDDHHHFANSQHHHGNLEHHNEAEHDHSIENHQMMSELRKLHIEYHPN